MSQAQFFAFHLLLGIRSKSPESAHKKDIYFAFLAGIAADIMAASFCHPAIKNDSSALPETARMAAHRRLDQSRVYPGAGGLRKRHRSHLTAKGWMYYRTLDDFFHGRIPRN